MYDLMRSLNREQFTAMYEFARHVDNRCSRYGGNFRRTAEIYNALPPGTYLEVQAFVRARNEEPELTERQEAITAYHKRHSGPVYYWHYARDCDLMESAYAMAFDNEWEAQEYIEDAYDGAEGPMSFTRLTAEEYDQARGESYRCDIAAAMMGY